MVMNPMVESVNHQEKTAHKLNTLFRQHRPWHHSANSSSARIAGRTLWTNRARSRRKNQTSLGFDETQKN